MAHPTYRITRRNNKFYGFHYRVARHGTTSTTRYPIAFPKLDEAMTFALDRATSEGVEVVVAK